MMRSELEQGRLSRAWFPGGFRSHGHHYDNYNFVHPFARATANATAA